MIAVARLSAAVAVVVLTVGVCMVLAADFELNHSPRGFKNPVLAMQMARSITEVEAIIGEPGHSDRSQMRSQQRMDFFFILAYWWEFVLLSVLLWQRRFPRARYLALIAALCATLAAVLDFRENLLILEVLSVPALQENVALVQTVRATALAKWSLLYVAMIPLAFIFIGRKDGHAHQSSIDRIIFFLPGLLFITAAIIGLIGIGREAMLATMAPTILFLSSLTLAAGLVALTVALFRSPSALLRGL